MPWVRSEYIQKGLFLAFLLFLAVQNPTWENIGYVTLSMSIGLGIGLGLALLLQIRNLGQLVQKPFSYVIFTMLENPYLIYGGVLIGLIYGIFSIQEGEDYKMLGYFVACGSLIGLGFGQVRLIKKPWYRLGFSMLVMGVVIYAISQWMEQGQFLNSPEKRQMLGILMLIGLPFFYLLTFIGEAEESEMEIATICAVMGFAFYLLEFPKTLPAAGFLIPITIYFLYATRILNGLRVFKHVLRGYSYLKLGRIKSALLAAYRGRELLPTSQMSRQLLWDVHSRVDINRLEQDPETMALLDLNLCLNRAAMLICGDHAPTAAQLEESNRLLDLVHKQWPRLQSHVDYYRTIAQLHEKRFDEAAEHLTHLLDVTKWETDDTYRPTILYPAWQLALQVHPEMKSRVGEVQLPLPGRRVEAIGAVERQLAETPGEASALQLKQLVYAQLSEEEFQQALAERKTEYFDYVYLEQLGARALQDMTHWQSGVPFLNMVAQGRPDRGPGIYQMLSQVYERANQPEEANRYLRKVKEVGLKVGIPNLFADQKQIFFSVVKKLAEDAAMRQDYDEAIQNYSIYTQCEASGKETLRNLAEMYKQKRDAIQALRITEKAISLYGTDADLDARKDSYYYSVELAQLEAIKDEVKPYFDVNYCVTKGKAQLDSRSEDLEILDWAEHLIKLALIMQPRNLVAMVQQARCHLRRGNTEEALRFLEDVREMTPSGSDEKEAWFFTQKQLGKLYLETYTRPDLAVDCLKKYQESLKSGAETIYDLGRAYEALGDIPKAIQHYKQVTAYEQHPLRWEAEEAIRRLQQGSAV